jgi:hypothetical protein
VADYGAVQMRITSIKPSHWILLLLLALGGWWAIANLVILKRVHKESAEKDAAENLQAELQIRRVINAAGGFDNVTRMSHGEFINTAIESSPDKHLLFHDYRIVRANDGEQYICFYFAGRVRFAIDRSLAVVARKQMLKRGVADDPHPRG